MARNPKSPVAPDKGQNTQQSTEDSLEVVSAKEANVPAEAPSEDGQQASEDGGAETSEAILTVICHAAEGRRRVGRRWPHGETVIDADDLSEIEVQILRADPRFTVKG